MKKTVAILLIAVMALSFVACAGKKIVGEWELTKVEGKAAVKEGITWTFAEEGNYIVDTEPDKPAEEKKLTEGLYEVKGSKLYLDGETDGYYKLSFSGNTMTLKGAEATLTFTKK